MAQSSKSNSIPSPFCFPSETGAPEPPEHFLSPVGEHYNRQEYAEQERPYRSRGPEQIKYQLVHKILIELYHQTTWGEDAKNAHCCLHFEFASANDSFLCAEH
jgi:hypothetical protein